jgi:hypothetical protein
VCRKIVPFPCNQIHNQECDIAGDVNVTKISIEFDAIKCRDTVRQTHQVGQMQITVAIADVAVVKALPKDRLECLKLPFCPLAQAVQLGAVDEAVQRSEVVPYELFR